MALALSLLGGPAPARDVGEETVRTAVLTWVHKLTAEARPEAEIERVEPWFAGQEIAAYIVLLRDGGFCLAGANDAILPVYFYSPHGRFDPAGSDLRYILEEIGQWRAAARWDEASGANEASRTEHARLWAALAAGIVPPSEAPQGIGGPPPEGTRSVPPMLVLPLTCLWDQGPPYNDQLPHPDPAGAGVWTGCNATATAQIMYYWKWPPSGVGSSSILYDYRWRSTWDSEPVATQPPIPGAFNGRLRYSGSYLQMNGYWDDGIYAAAQSISSDGGWRAALAALYSRLTHVSLTVPADYGNHTYDWSTMVDSPPPGPDPAAAAVAFLMHDVTVACISTLGMWSTNSYFGNDAIGLRDHLRYDPDVLFTPPPSTDIYALTAEIAWGRPAGLGGSNSQGGHAWVVYGYNTSTDPHRQFKMNFGHSGSQDGWYTIDGTPPNPPWPYQHDMMTLVAPTKVKFVGSTSSGDGSPSAPYLDLEQAVAGAPDGSTLMLEAGSTNTYHGFINRRLLLNGWGARIE